MPVSYPEFPSHRRMLAYLHSYVGRFDLTRHVVDDCQVQQVERTDSGYTVRSVTGERRYSALALCAGESWWSVWARVGAIYPTSWRQTAELRMCRCVMA